MRAQVGVEDIKIRAEGSTTQRQRAGLEGGEESKNVPIDVHLRISHKTKIDVLWDNPH